MRSITQKQNINAKYLGWFILSTQPNFRILIFCHDKRKFGEVRVERNNKTSCGEKYNIVKTRIVQFSFPPDMSAKPGHTSLFPVKQTIFMKSSDSLFVKFCLYLGHKSPNTTYTHLLTLNLEFSNVNIMCRSIVIFPLQHF